MLNRTWPPTHKPSKPCCSPQLLAHTATFLKICNYFSNLYWCSSSHFLIFQTHNFHNNNCLRLHSKLYVHSPPSIDCTPLNLLFVSRRHRVPTNRYSFMIHLWEAQTNDPLPHQPNKLKKKKKTKKRKEKKRKEKKRKNQIAILICSLFTWVTTRRMTLRNLTSKEVSSFLDTMAYASGHLYI